MQLEFDKICTQQFRSNIYIVGVVVLGLRHGKHREWFDENVHRLITLKIQISCTKTYLSAPDEDKNPQWQYFKMIKSSLQRKIPQMKN